MDSNQYLYALTVHCHTNLATEEGTDDGRHDAVGYEDRYVPDLRQALSPPSGVYLLSCGTYSIGLGKFDVPGLKSLNIIHSVSTAYRTRRAPVAVPITMNESRLGEEDAIRMKITNEM